MTAATVRVFAEETFPADSDAGDQLHTTELERVSVSFPAEEGGDVVCMHCHEAITEGEEDGQWVTFYPNEPTCREAGPQHCSACDGMGETVEGDAEAVECPTCNGSGEVDGPHKPETGPGTWCNSAAVIVNDEEDSVTVTISVGDPRGAFAFTVRKVPAIIGPDGETVNGDLAGRLILHVPYPGEGMPHETLTELHPGTFLVGGAR